MTDEWRQARRAAWRQATERFDDWPDVGKTPDGNTIRRHPTWGDGVREDSGYICSPVAYNGRRATGYTWFVDTEGTN